MKYLIYILLFTTFLFGLISAPPQLIKIKSVNCFSQFGQCSKNVEGKLKSFEGQTLITSEKKVKDYLSSDIQVDKFTLKFVFPTTLRIDLLEKKPFCSVSEIGSDRAFLIDNKGKVLSYGESDPLGVLKIDQKAPSIGSNVTDMIVFACKMVKGVYFQKKIINAAVKNNELTIDFEGNLKVIFPVEGDYKTLVGSITLIFNRIKIDTLKDRVVDLRFKNPVIRQI